MLRRAVHRRDRAHGLRRQVGARRDPPRQHQRRPARPRGLPRSVKAAGIGTYQVFQETYHHETYDRVHPKNTIKGDYEWRLDALSRAWEVGLDDVGIGALFGLYDWKFDTLALVRHAQYLMERFDCGPHTISFPRMQAASGIDMGEEHLVSDDEFKRLVACCGSACRTRA
jgi:2-iminoacetate synthase